MSKQEENNSPIKRKPLRHAGQSIEEEINRIIDDKIMMYMIGSTYFIAMAISQWGAYLSKTKISPILMTVIAIICTILTIYNTIKYRKKLKHLRQGRMGECEVAEQLEWFVRERKCMVLHDVVNEKGNIDHVMVSTKGIFTIETKTVSLRKKHDGQIHFDGESITIDGFKSNKHVKQAAAEANWLRTKLKELIGFDFPTKGVLLYPGWWVDGMIGETAKGPIWALKPENLFRYIDKLPERITERDVNIITNTIAGLIRA